MSSKELKALLGQLNVRRGSSSPSSRANARTCTQTQTTHTHRAHTARAHTPSSGTYTHSLPPALTYKPHTHTAHTPRTHTLFRHVHPLSATCTDLHYVEGDATSKDAMKNLLIDIASRTGDERQEEIEAFTGASHPVPSDARQRSKKLFPMCQKYSSTFANEGIHCYTR